MSRKRNTIDYDFARFVGVHRRPAEEGDEDADKQGQSKPSIPSVRDLVKETASHPRPGGSNGMIASPYVSNSYILALTHIMAYLSLSLSLHLPACMLAQLVVL
jgi:hypothetical protein